MEAQNQSMNKYGNTKIYLLIDKSINSIFYVGSTVQSLSQRLSEHKTKSFHVYRSDFNCKKSVHIRSMDLNKLSIFLIENYPCETKQEKLYRERFWIEFLKPSHNTINSITSSDEKRMNKSDVIKCCCGFSYTAGNKSQHINSQLHNDGLMLRSID